MRQVLAVAAREFVERKLVIAAGAVLAVLILFTPMLPGVSGFSRGDIIGVASGWVSVMILFVGTLIMGMTSINGDLTERRLGFYFSRPMSGFAIWLGKVAGVLAVVIATAAITFLPAGVDGVQSLFEADASGIAIFVWAVLGFFFFGHIVGCFARVRSAWLLLDFAGVFIVVASGVALFEFYFRLLPLDSVVRFVYGSLGKALCALILVAVIASLAGLTHGRVDPGRVHRWTSITLWSVSFAAIVAVWVVSFWVAGATPADISPSDDRTVSFAPGDGEWMLVSGPARAGLPQRFIAGDREQFLPLGSRSLLYLSSSRAIAVQPSPVFRVNMDRGPLTGTVVVADLEDGGGWVRTKIEYDMNGVSGEPVVSPSGERMAIHADGTLAVYSLPDERLIRAIPLELDRSDSLNFVGEDRLHVTRPTSLDGTDGLRRIEVTSVDVSTARWETRASFDAEAYLMDPTWRFVLTKTGRERRLLDLENGSTVGSFEARVHLHTTRWLSDGTLAVPDTTPGGGRVLRIMDREGTELQRIEFPNDDMLRLGSEPRAGALMATVSADHEPDQCKDRRLLTIDLKTGTIRQIGKGLTAFWAWQADRVPPGSPAARTFITCDGGTVRFDADLASSETLLD